MKRSIIGLFATVGCAALLCCSSASPARAGEAPLAHATTPARDALANASVAPVAQPRTASAAQAQRRLRAHRRRHRCKTHNRRARKARHARKRPDRADAATSLRKRNDCKRADRKRDAACKRRRRHVRGVCKHDGAGHSRAGRDHAKHGNADSGALGAERVKGTKQVRHSSNRSREHGSAARRTARRSAEANVDANAKATSKAHAKPKADAKAKTKTKPNAPGKANAQKNASRGKQRAAAQASTGACAHRDVTPSTTNLALVDAATLCLINREREAAGLRALTANSALARSAQAHTESMVAENYFGHYGPDGETPATRMRLSGYIYSTNIGYDIGENIAWGTLSLATPQAIVAVWMASPEHRANILNPRFRDTAIGALAELPKSVGGGEPGAIYTEDFGVIITG